MLSDCALGETGLSIVRAGTDEIIVAFPPGSFATSSGTVSSEITVDNTLGDEYALKVMDLGGDGCK